MHFSVGLPFGNLRNKSHGMVHTGEFNTLSVLRLVSFGAYLDDGGRDIAPVRYVPPD